MTSLRIAVTVLALACFLPPAEAQSKIDSLNLTFTRIDVPGATVTNVWSINSAGAMVGTYSTASDTSGHGFLYSGGAFTYIEYPGTNGTFVNGINDLGQVVGYSYIKGDTAAVSFLYQSNSFTTVRAPGDSATFAYGINNKGVIAGGDGVVEGTKGFVRIGKSYKMIEPSGVYGYVYLTGMNKDGEIVGTTLSPDTAFTYKNGAFQTIDILGAIQVWALGINDSSIVVGYDSQCSLTSCFLQGFVLRNGKVITISYPGALSTAVDGINNLGQLVGSYTLDNQTWHGFVTTPVTSDSSAAH